MLDLPIILNRRITEKSYNHPHEKRNFGCNGPLCPLPVLKLRKHLKPMDNGSLITVLADDPAAAIDIPHFCNETGNKLVSKTNSENGVKEYTVKKVN